LSEEVVEDFAFVFEDGGDALFDGVAGEKSRHGDRVTLADAMSAVDGLVLDRGVPPAVEKEDVIGELEVQSDAAGSIAHQEYVAILVSLESVEQRRSVCLGDTAVILQGSIRLECLSQDLQGFHPLTEYNGFPSTIGDFFDIGEQELKFGTFTGQWIEIADLLQTHYELKNMLDADGVPQLVQVQDAFRFSA